MARERSKIIKLVAKRNGRNYHTRNYVELGTISGYLKALYRIIVSFCVLPTI